VILLAFFVLLFVVGALLSSSGRALRVKPVPPTGNDSSLESDGHDSSQPEYEGQAAGKRGW
jgi:hypothetical protein